MSFKEMMKEIFSSASGKIGFGLFAMILAVSIYVVATYPMDFGNTRWSNPAVWSDNPKAVPPFWSNWFTSRNLMPHKSMSASQPMDLAMRDPGQTRIYRFPVDFTFDEPPTFISFTVKGVTYHKKPPVMEVFIERPDGETILTFRDIVQGPRPGEQAPFKRYHETPFRKTLSGSSLVLSDLGLKLLKRYELMVPEKFMSENIELALFGRPDELDVRRFSLLHGAYELRIEITTQDASDEVQEVYAVLGGSVFGVMGTDAVGRDLWEGLLFGFPVALAIAILASVFTTAIGVSLGITSGYIGGKTDLVIQRLADIVSNVPVLPLLIFLVFVLGSNLPLIILLLVIFSWPGLTILVRAMVLQVRSGQLVEAALSLGASRKRIMIRHIFPHTAPFILAQMIFLAPSAILAEAALSFLGLGDPSLPTWGQILEAGFRTGAVYVGYWWWIIPPGLLIVMMALAFMLLALATEPVVNPRLRRLP